ncbi:MAG: bifunctional homocysteine S-methyltransferase/methylenetetrahydrofolate reductase [Clostridia bacterium]|nr:bifunctional homocysteine S-methyltransferase/methylenetetrahydrofolate reductase [Clostridia bacterium]
MGQRQAILTSLQSRALLFDGATGTYAKSVPGFPEGAVECASLIAPDMVFGLHMDYIRAGCSMIKTNTFAAHPGLAARDESHQREIIEASFGIARRAAESSGAIVFADIGPAPAKDEQAEAYIRMADIFLDLGADCFLFETLSSDNGILEAADHIRKQKPDAFIVVSFASEPDGFTRSGEYAPAMIERLQTDNGIDAVGLNCICGAYHMRRLAGQIQGLKKPFIAMPNAGYPQLIDGRVYYDSDPAYFAEQVSACVQAGAKIVGGCCGTTPAHIAQLSRMLSVREEKIKRSELLNKRQEAECGSLILSKLRQGGKPILVELDPPRSSLLGGFMEGARQICAAGADAITIADCPIGRASMDASILACKLKREYNIETMPHMTCRDRNVNATKALLMGLSMEGVHNVLAVTGDPVPAAERESIKSVFQFHSRVLARFVNELSRGGDAEPFFLCGALNINAVNFDAELEKAKLKEEAGMQAFLTQPVLSEQAARNLHRARGALSGYLFGGLFPVVSQKNARFLDNEVAGMLIDPRVIQAYEGLDRVQGEALAEKLCEDVVRRISQDVDGYYIMTPFQRIDLVKRIVRRIAQK